MNNFLLKLIFPEREKSPHNISADYKRHSQSQHEKRLFEKLFVSTKIIYNFN